MNATDEDDALQKEIKEHIVYADEDTLRAIYAYLAPIELSLSAAQDEMLRDRAAAPAMGEILYYSWKEMKDAITAAGWRIK